MRAAPLRRRPHAFSRIYQSTKSVLSAVAFRLDPSAKLPTPGCAGFIHQRAIPYHRGHGYR